MNESRGTAPPSAPGPGERIRLRVNGKERSAPARVTIRGLLEELDLVPETVVVEHNREIVERARYDEVPLTDGDQVEIVHFVGGG